MKYTEARINEATNLSRKLLQGNDSDFFKRIWQTSTEVYKNRIEAIGFTNANIVLDAGCGFGQWTLALSQLNKEIEALELNETRIETCKTLFKELQIKNTKFKKGNIECLPYQDNTFDLVFSYSVIFLSDYRKALKEFYRVMKSGGKLYFNTNGLGWYLYNLMDGHNESTNFSSKKMAIVALKNTLSYYALGNTEPGVSIITPKKIIIDDLEKIGFKNIIVDSEGCIKTNNFISAKSFFKGDYYGEEGVFEVLAEK